MKKTMIVIMAIILFIGVSVLFFQTGKKDVVHVGSFDLADYQWAIDSFSSSEKIGRIIDVDDVVTKSTELWRQLYGELSGEPIEVFFDENNDCWLLRGTLPKGWLGGTPHIIVQSSGAVLAVWHEQ